MSPRSPKFTTVCWGGSSSVSPSLGVYTGCPDNVPCTFVHGGIGRGTVKRKWRRCFSPLQLQPKRPLSTPTILNFGPSFQVEASLQPPHLQRNLLHLSFGTQGQGVESTYSCICAHKHSLSYCATRGQASQPRSCHSNLQGRERQRSLLHVVLNMPSLHFNPNLPVNNSQSLPTAHVRFSHHLPFKTFPPRDAGN